MTCEFQRIDLLIVLGSPGPMETINVFPEIFVVVSSLVPAITLTNLCPPPAQPSFLIDTSILWKMMEIMQQVEREKKTYLSTHLSVKCTGRVLLKFSLSFRFKVDKSSVLKVDWISVSYSLLTWMTKKSSWKANSNTFHFKNNRRRGFLCQRPTVPV